MLCETYFNCQRSGYEGQRDTPGQLSLAAIFQGQAPKSRGLKVVMKEYLPSQTFYLFYRCDLNS